MAGCSVHVVVGVAVMVMVMMPTDVSAVVFPSPVPEENDADYWYLTMHEELQEALRVQHNNRIAKNIVLFLGDGLGVTVNTAARIMKGQKAGWSGEEGYLVWDRFPNMALLKTYNLDKQVSDSSGTATAYLTGVKGNFKTVGVTGRVKPGDCEASLDPANRLDSIIKWAQDSGKHTGLVTNTQVTHATPSGLYAKSAHRYWQCDSWLKKDGIDNCKDIARQLVEDDPGKNIRVILGGGREVMGAPKEKLPYVHCPREDGRNLVAEWKEEKEMRGEKAEYVTTAEELVKVDVNSTDFLMGLFSERHMSYYLDGVDGPEGTPTLPQMVDKALEILKKAEYGFFLLVEGGLIDKGLHHTKPGRALEEVIQMEEAVSLALSSLDLDETLIIVTADHSHAMTFAGYPVRGNHILGVTTFKYVTDGLPYTPLMFTTGPGFFYSWDGKKVQRRNLTGVDTTDKDFVSQSAVPTVSGEETHGGEDVAVYATGPMSHLFHRVHEQTYVAHVMAYAACVGPYLNACHRPRRTHHPEPQDHTHHGSQSGHQHHTDHMKHSSHQDHTSSQSQLGHQAHTHHQSHTDHESESDGSESEDESKANKSKDENKSSENEDENIMSKSRSEIIATQNDNESKSSARNDDIRESESEQETEEGMREVMAQVPENEQSFGKYHRVQTAKSSYSRSGVRSFFFPLLLLPLLLLGQFVLV